MARNGHDMIVVGASAGGIETLKQLVQTLPPDLNASVVVVVHISGDHKSYLPEILDRAGPLPAVTALDNTLFEKGRIYVAPPDHHVLLEPDRLKVVRGPKENRHRPAIDPLFRSAAWALGPRVSAVVLSGTLDDGAAGLWAVGSTGGATIVQDPDEAAFSGMPTSALLYSKIDHCLPVREIGPLLVRLAHESEAARSAPDELGEEITMDRKNQKQKQGQGKDRPLSQGEAREHLERVGDLSAFTCPSCGGALWELQEGSNLHYRCHVGHAFNGESLVAEQSELVERAVYTAMRSLREKAEMMRRVGGELNPHGNQARLEDRARELEGAAQVLQDLLQRGKT